MISFTQFIIYFFFYISIIIFILLFLVFLLFFNTIKWHYTYYYIVLINSILNFRNNLYYSLHSSIISKKLPFNKKILLLTLFKDIYILIASTFSVYKKSFFNVWYMYINEEIESILFECIVDKNFFFYYFNKKKINLNYFKFLNIYYSNWQNFFLSTNFFYFYYNVFNNFKFKNYKKSTFRYANSIESLTFKKNIKFNKNFIFSNFLVYFNFIKTTVVSLLISVVFFYYLIFYFYINILKQLAIWLIIGLLFFWLISGFNFFLKRGRFGKLTSSLFRFWKRANVCFWVVEGFLFLLFFYYYLNSSQEPVYMYDYSSLNQSYLPNIYLVYCSTFLLVITIYYYYYWTLNLPNFSQQQNLISATFITVVLLYFYLVESYQFYYVLTLFFENFWIFNHETNLWVLEVESPRLRVKQQYLILALIAKYWHFIFIFLSWIFFILKIFEQKRTYITHSGFNLQNLFILFWLNFLFILQWFKWVIRRFLDGIYYWFLTDSNFHFIKYLFNELINIFTCDVRHQF